MSGSVAPGLPRLLLSATQGRASITKKATHLVLKILNQAKSCHGGFIILLASFSPGFHENWFCLNQKVCLKMKVLLCAERF